RRLGFDRRSRRSQRKIWDSQIRLSVIQPKETKIWEKSLAASVEGSGVGGCKSQDSVGIGVAGFGVAGA
ncbi:hypothetical protein U1Q18_009066, partial [Sarracenia purpurea var. burkii]